MTTLLALVLGCYGLYLVLSGCSLVFWALLQFMGFDTDGDD